MSLRKIKNNLLTAFYRYAFKIFFRVRVYFEDPLQKNDPPQGIYICNHMTHLDGILIRGIFKNITLYSIVTSDWMEKPWARALLFYENCISIDRENPGTAWIHEARRAIKEGASINIFPEGHTSRSEEMDVFKPGFLLLAGMLKDIPIIPVATTGKYRFLFGKPKKILIGKPIYAQKDRLKDQESLEAYAADFRSTILTMKNRLKEM